MSNWRTASLFSNLRKTEVKGFWRLRSRPSEDWDQGLLKLRSRPSEDWDQDLQKLRLRPSEDWDQHLQKTEIKAFKRLRIISQPDDQKYEKLKAELELTHEKREIVNEWHGGIENIVQINWHVKLVRDINSLIPRTELTGSNQEKWSTSQYYEKITSASMHLGTIYCRNNSMQYPSNEAFSHVVCSDMLILWVPTGEDTLLTTDCWRQTADDRLLTTDCWRQTADHRLLTTDCWNRSRRSLIKFIWGWF